MKLDNFKDHGLLLMRIGLGLMFVVHGWPKISGGPEKWAKLGGAMESFGIGFAPEFWGFAAAFGEFGGGALLALGLLTRPALTLLTSTMLVAALMHIDKGDSFNKWSHAAEAAITFAGLFLIGPGRFSLDARFFSKQKSEVSPA